MNQFTNELSNEVYESTYRYDDETIEGTQYRVAHDIASIEKDKDLWTSKFVDILKNFKFVPGGRILSNAGIGLKGTTYINCFVDGFIGKDLDSMPSISRALSRQALILKSEGGYGFCCDVLRPKGGFIEGIANESPGAVRMLDMWNTQSFVITAGSGKKSDVKKSKQKIRKGAQMVTMSCWHPDVEDFITAKQTSGRLDKFNMSVLITDEFMNSVFNNLKWDLVFPDFDAVKHIYEDEWDGNIKKWVENGHPVKIYKTYKNANELWNLIMKSTYNRNEPGVLFIDTINRFNNLYYNEYISATNPCVVGDTLIAVADGRNAVSIKQLTEENKSVPVYSTNSMGQVQIKWGRNPRITGKNQEVWKLNLDDGSFLIATSNHKIYLKDNTYKELKDLKEGDSISSFYSFESNDGYRKIDQASENHKVVNVEFYGYEDVYNITVDDNHNYNVITSFDDNKYIRSGGICVKNCGEQILPVGGVCLLGNLNLTQFIKDDNWDYEKLKEVIPVAVRFMDNVNDLTYVPLQEQKDNLVNKRRIGLGIMGYGSALLMMKKRYGSKEALDMTEQLMSFMANTAYQSSALLAEEKGCFSLYNEEEYLNSKFISNLSEETRKLIKKNGIRNSHLLSIQPTGNSSVFANVVSGGLEPIFLFEYIRTVIQSFPPAGLYLPTNIDFDGKTFIDVEGRKQNEQNIWEWIKEGDENMLKTIFNNSVYKIDKGRGLLKESSVVDYGVRHLQEINEWDPDSIWAANINNLTLKEHIDTMRVISKYIDSSMSKTINITKDYPYEDFKNVYVEVYKSGTIKGCTTYRAGTMATVLKEKDEPEKQSIIINNTPKRPSMLECDVVRFTSKGVKWVGFVGLDYRDKEWPYEIFTGLLDNFYIPNYVDRGFIKKEKVKDVNGDIVSRYDFIYHDKDGFEVIMRGLNRAFDREFWNVGKLLSGLLRHHIHLPSVVKIVDSLKLDGDTIGTWKKGIVRILKKYIKDDDFVLTGETCDNCGSKNLVYKEGCVSCNDCHTWSKCG